MTFKHPYGVVAAIIPWKVPLVFFALAAGNTRGVEKQRESPIDVRKVATLVEKVGFPPGVLNIISGHGQSSGATLSSHMDVRAPSFIGSCRRSRLIQAAASKSNLKHVVLEVGGPSYFTTANLTMQCRRPSTVSNLTVDKSAWRTAEYTCKTPSPRNSSRRSKENSPRPRPEILWMRRTTHGPQGC